MFKIVDMDIFDSTEKFLCHQANCVAVGRAAGIAAAIYAKYPRADIYKDRQVPDKAGTIIVSEEKYDRTIINMLGQYFPGPVQHSTQEKIDSETHRLLYFRECLFEITKAYPNGSFAFPWRIGCGLAGGDWGEYITVLKDFEKYISGDVTIYRIEE